MLLSGEVTETEPVAVPVASAIVKRLWWAWNAASRSTDILILSTSQPQHICCIYSKTLRAFSKMKIVIVNILARYIL